MIEFLKTLLFGVVALPVLLALLVGVFWTLDQGPRYLGLWPDHYAQHDAQRDANRMHRRNSRMQMREPLP